MSTLLIQREATNSLTAIPAAQLDGKFIRVQIAGIAGANSAHVNLNGNQILSMPTTNGATFFTELCFTWNSTNQDVRPETWLFGTRSTLSSFNPATFTFSTDVSHTITDFAVFA